MDGILYQIIDVSEYINFLQQKYQKLFLLIKIFFVDFYVIYEKVNILEEERNAHCLK